ncbi:uncharacterized protein C8R40DRAFT_1097763 [Lentinula edodes]|uniref:uncharacterized protein n=1 Tax=Lentinula edodes TaxID=5353 RepID=UPI001E8EE0E6|nr:uncharacterized protein C8R40DRAFT_1097763 [Lentinula edodes]KAH7876581.1 hypothetical protein C8R40DRAFT_1097763 [Lentinula edodes]
MILLSIFCYCISLYSDITTTYLIIAHNHSETRQYLYQRPSKRSMDYMDFYCTLSFSNYTIIIIEYPSVFFLFPFLADIFSFDL